MYALDVIWSIKSVLWWSSEFNWLSRSLFCGSSYAFRRYFNKAEVLRLFETRAEQISLLELFYIGFVFYLLQETICKDKSSGSESSLLFFLKVRLFVWANTEGAVSAQTENPRCWVSHLQAVAGG